MEEYPGAGWREDEANAFSPTKEALAAAQGDPDAGVRKAATFALAVIGDRQALAAYHTPQVVDALLGAFSAPEAELRRTAAEAFVFRREPRAVEPLLALAQDDDPRVCMVACQALAGSGDPRAVAPLLALLQHADAARRQAAARTLAQVDDRCVPDALAALIRDPDPDVRQAVLSALAQHNDPRALDPLADALQSRDAKTRRNAAAMLEGSINNPQAVDLLIAALQDPDKYVRILAAQSLRHCREDRAARAVGALLGDPDFEVRQSVVGALGQMGIVGTAGAFEPLLLALRDRDRQIRQPAANALAQFRVKLPAETLLRAMQDPDPAVRRAVAPLLARNGDGKTHERLVLTLKGADAQGRKAALVIIREWGGQYINLRQVAGVLFEMAKDPDPAVRAAALEVLGYHRHDV